MRVVIALGGNALLHRGQRPDAAPQLDQVTRVAGPLADLATSHEVVLVHGNGPQVGLLALETAADPSLTKPYPLADLVAETQGLIGYWLQQAIGRHLDTPVVTLVTQTQVDPDDPAFRDPTKFVGSTYDQETANRLAADHGWAFKQDGPQWRRVVASPIPRRVIETETAELLLRRGVTVVLAGGGGIPVVPDGEGGLHGVDAVVDKDLAAALLARELGADLFLVLTDVEAVMVHFGTPQQKALADVTVEELSGMDLPAGSMGPKVEAVCDFVRATGRRAAIGTLADATDIFHGSAGTQVRPDSTGKPHRPR